MGNYVFTNGHIIGGEDRLALLPDCSVLVEGETITAVGKDMVIPPEAEIIDLEGAYLMPGLINLHVHLPGSGKPVSLSILPSGDSDEKQTFVKKWLDHSFKNGVARKVLQKMVKNSILATVHSGVTTVRSVGELYWTDLANRNEILAGKYVGPRLLVSGIGVSVPEGHMAGTMADICTTPEEARETVKRAADRGVDWIKIFVSGGVLDAVTPDSPGQLRMPLALATAACEEAHARGLKVASHAESTESVRVSLQAGVDSVEHGGALDEEIIQLYKKNKASVTLTISPALAIAALSEEETGMNDIQRACGKTAMDSMIQGAIQALEEGIPVGLGTDASCPYVTQYDMWREIYYFAKYCHVSNDVALHTATAINADLLGLHDVTGRMKPGLSADLIVTKENPLEDLQALRQVTMVMSQGQLIKNPRVKRNKTIDQALDAIL